MKTQTIDKNKEITLQTFPKAYPFNNGEFVSIMNEGEVIGEGKTTKAAWEDVVNELKMMGGIS